MPIAESIVSPAGSTGDTLHSVIIPPPLVNVSGTISLTTVYTTVASCSVNPAGGANVVLPVRQQHRNVHCHTFSRHGHGSSPNSQDPSQGE
ncbi:hypothetical protein [Cupriavidus sp. IDO]|uniref:hypothetical protein n=1 Tax=Cupriavidus sp. IDO TaxID=1539142 RepID=UPI00187BF9EA|nr:hypothetical protein [Cupriavidus sp. IDO]